MKKPAGPRSHASCVARMALMSALRPARSTVPILCKPSCVRRSPHPTQPPASPASLLCSDVWPLRLCVRSGGRRSFHTTSAHDSRRGKSSGAFRKRVVLYRKSPQNVVM
ncbi:hypothetical protein BC628DRAFT_1192344 [Trametes gibbosa]|nr:hypothetical protein BC628DRAFT_1192344 [Trametes gibbosa]